MTPLQIQTAADFKAWCIEHGYNRYQLHKEGVASKRSLDSYWHGKAKIPKPFKLALKGLVCLDKHK